MPNKNHLMSLVIISSTLFALPLTAHADLTLANNTSSNLTSITNESFCSSAFGDQGIIKAYSTITVFQSELSMVCGSNTTACKTDLYMSNDCSGPKIGSITLNVDFGVTNTESSGPYTITALNPFNVQINPA